MALIKICTIGNCDKPIFVGETDTIPRKGEYVSVSLAKDAYYGTVARVQYRYYSNTRVVEVMVIIDPDGTQGKT